MRTPFRSFALGLFALLAAGTARADYLYSVSGLPSPVISGQSIVVFSANPAPVHPMSGTATADLTLGNVLGFRGSNPGSDSFNSPFTMKVDFADPAIPGSGASVSFAGLLQGSLGSNPSLTLQFTNNPQSFSLGANQYTVSVPTAPIPVSGNGTQAPFGVHVAAAAVPEPSTLLLAACAAPLAGLLRRRRKAAP